jgi:uncharacterized membrane protein required for colicin V production
MGLDLALGVFVLIWAVRGWFRGFVLQAITLGALIGSVYLADPVRNALRPYVFELFPAIAAPILDRLLWWCSAVASFVVVSGLGSWVVKIKRKRPYGEVEPNRTDQGAGFLLGAAKGAVVASFLMAGIARYAPNHVKPGGAIEAQTRSSQALSWSIENRPAERLWESNPVQSIVAHVRRRGFWEDEGGDAGRPTEAEAATAESSAPKAEGPAEPPPAPPDDVRTVSRAPSLQVPRPRTLDPDSPTFERELDEALERLDLGSP